MPNSLSLHPLPFTKDTISAEALMLSTVGLNGVFEHLGILIHILLDSSNGTQWVTIRSLAFNDIHIIYYHMDAQ